MSHSIDTLLAEQSAQVATIEVALRMANVAYVKTNPGPGEYSSVVSALAAISTNSVSSPWLVMVGPGVYTETAITMKPYVHVMGSGDEITRLIASSTTGTFITAADNASISRCLISGASGVGGIGISYSGTTGTDSTPFTVTSCRLGAHETLARVSASSAALQMTFFDCRIGGPYTFSNGFLATTSGAGTARIQLMGCTTNGTNTNTINYIGNATGAGCEIIVNACQFRSTTLTTGVGFRCDTGGGLRMSSLNIRNFATGISVPNTGAAPVIRCNSILIQDCTADINIAHPSCTGSFNGVANSDNITNASGVTLQFQDPDYGSVCNNITDIRGFRTQNNQITVANVTTTLVASSPYTMVLSGTVTGQIMKMPDATTVKLGHRLEFWNKATVSFDIQNNAGTLLMTVPPNDIIRAVCNNISTAAGTWLFEIIEPSTTSLSASHYFDDFMNSDGGSDNGFLSWSTDFTGTGADLIPQNAEANKPGIFQLFTGTTATGGTSMDLGTNSMVFATANTVTWKSGVRVPTLSTAAQEFAVYFGISDSVVTGTPTNGIWFSYVRGTTTLWRCTTSNGGTTTNTNSATTVTAGSWVNFEIVVNGTSSVVFKINGAIVATHTTNITTNPIGPMYKIFKSAGTTGRGFDVDYFDMLHTFTR